jgi:hypothetical protein
MSKRKPNKKIIFIVGLMGFIGLARNIVFRFIIEHSSLRDFVRPLGNNNNRSIFI